MDRRFFKVRELAYEGVLRVEHIDTKLNASDLLTKPLPYLLFEAHRRRVLNLGAQESKRKGEDETKIKARQVGAPEG